MTHDTDAPTEAGDLDHEQVDTAPGFEFTRLYRKVWYRAQIASAVNEMRKLLRFRVPSLSLVTHVENGIFGFHAHKVDARKARFQNEGNGDKGIFEIRGNGLGCFVGPEKGRTETTRHRSPTRSTTFLLGKPRLTVLPLNSPAGCIDGSTTLGQT